MTDGRINDYLTGLPMPEMVDSPIFPFKGEMSVRTVRPFDTADHIRPGDPGGPPCGCEAATPAIPAIWSNDRWQVRPIRFVEDRPAPFPAYMLETVAHLDIDDLDEAYGSELGLLTLRLDRAIRAIGSVGRVHFNRWGDGGAHFHVWFLGRPIGGWQLSGYTLPLWGFTLPSLSVSSHLANDRIVSRHLRDSET